MASTFAGFSYQDMADYFGIPLPQATALVDYATTGQLPPDEATALAQINPARLGPGGDIAWGLQHDIEHPKGSHYHGDFNVNPITLLANIATGGLYGLGQAGFNALSGQQNLLGAASSGLNQLGPYGSAVYPISPTAAEVGNIAGAGAGLIGGGLSALSPSGFGAAGSEGAEAGNVAGSLSAAGGGGVAGGAGGSSLASLLGLGVLSNSLLGAFGQGGGQPQGGQLGGGLSSPTGGAVGGAQGLTPQQLAALSAMQSEAHRGLAPTFEAKMKGRPLDPGLAGSDFFT